ncbi:MAG: DUF1015 domain-containing protein [Ktedonobacterales bacterium]
MADIRPLPGIRYGESADLAKLVTPPYDVISTQAQARYYERHPENIIRLELGRDEPGDNDLNNRYTRAAVTFAEWRLRGVLRQDTPSLYLYQQRFVYHGTRYRRLGLLARVRLESWLRGIILPHEHTLSQPKDDRLRLLDACAANLSPIMALYEDPGRDLQKLLVKRTKAQPVVNFKDEVGEEHRLWQVAGDDLAADIAEFFRDRQLFIADGHHRYETCLHYRDQKTALYAPYKDALASDAINFTLMTLYAVEDPGLLVLPTHRILRNVDEGRIAQLERSLAPYFRIELLPATLTSDELLQRLGDAGEGDTTVAALVRSTDTLLLTLRPQGREAMEHLEGAQSSASKWWRGLDVAVLHELVLRRGLEISPEMVQAGEHVTYTREASVAIAAAHEVAEGENGTTLALLVRPTPPVSIRDVARAGDRMPQKSTYFYPKLITGLVINPLW